MRRKDREVTDQAAIQAILDKAQVLHLAMIDGDRPYVVPMHYGYTLENGRLTLYLHSAKEGRKLDILSKNSAVAFVLETDGYTSFSNACTRPFVRPADNSDYKFGRATHGYHPDKGPQPTLLACGPHIRSGVILDRRSILDEAPTYARILGVELPDAEGKAMEEILADC